MSNVFKFAIGAMVLVVLLMLGSCSFDRISPGYVGVKVSNIGTGSGVQREPIQVGWVFTPPGTTVYQYPVFTNTYTWKDGERLYFQDKNGLSVAAAVSISYRADARRAPALFEKYRQDLDTLLQGVIKNAVRDAINREASMMTVDQIYGPGKAGLIERARQSVVANLGRYGLVIESLTWTGPISLPANIQNQINQRVANEQEALSAQANVATREAEARAAVAQARGKAEAMQIESDAISSNPQILRLRAIEKWNGVLPTYVAGNAPIPMIQQ